MISWLLSKLFPLDVGTLGVLESDTIAYQNRLLRCQHWSERYDLHKVLPNRKYTFHPEDEIYVDVEFNSKEKR